MLVLPAKVMLAGKKFPSGVAHLCSASLSTLGAIWHFTNREAGPHLALAMHELEHQRATSEGN